MVLGNDIWSGDGEWKGWRISKDPSENSSGSVLISPSGKTYRPGDIEPNKYTQSDLARALGVSRGAIADRVRRGTLPDYDGPKYWLFDTIKYLLPQAADRREKGHE